MNYNLRFDLLDTDVMQKEHRNFKTGIKVSSSVEPTIKKSVKGLKQFLRKKKL